MVVIDRWLTPPFLAVDKASRIAGDALSAQAVCLIVGERAREIGLEFSHHDGGRSFAKPAHKGKCQSSRSDWPSDTKVFRVRSDIWGNTGFGKCPGQYLGVEVE